MEELPAKKRSGGVCDLTGAAMEALVGIEQALLKADGESLSPLEFRTLMWARCSLAALYGIRADEILAAADMGSIHSMLGPGSFEALLFD
jgi:hypothetical protein